ncbi:DUF3105 domain-containing protein [Streptomyces ureilyticus]|uniref:DUF3105 domain-containing protein n=1 Tax=Streptomyces ureilyticus TaxID=1775131 RepID=A0ABX0E726_9ACTN|nr:DUF3105 domain-containing protein [Streptomyces ureilyticus]NGO48849.1 DUF3105 domain-containing protein [Streptomyces ureilyticus]
MGSAKNKASASRKARIEEMRRAEKARERRNRILTITASVVIVGGLVAGGAYLISTQSEDDSSTSSAAQKGKFTTGKDGVRTWNTKLTQNHVSGDVKYAMNPPVGGDHNQVWMNCDGDVYTKELSKTNAVHSLEHGAVWVTYNSKASDADVKALADKVEKTPYSLMSPVEDQKDPIMLSAWGAQRAVTSAKDPNVNTFFEKYVQGEQTPEKGAACTGGLAK